MEYLSSFYQKKKKKELSILNHKKQQNRLISLASCKLPPISLASWECGASWHRLLMLPKLNVLLTNRRGTHVGQWPHESAPTLVTCDLSNYH